MAAGADGRRSGWPPEEKTAFPPSPDGAREPGRGAFFRALRGGGGWGGSCTGRLRARLLSPAPCGADGPDALGALPPKRLCSRGEEKGCMGVLGKTVHVAANFRTRGKAC